MPVKVVVAPQGFKGSVTGLEAARAIQRGILAAMPDAETALAPVADGGDGTLNALVDATGGRVFSTKVTGPLGHPIEASWGVMGDGETAVVEMARASGLALLPPQRRDPRITTTRGTGEIIQKALNQGFKRIIVGLGGSATNDGGAGMASALGARFSDPQGRALEEGGAALARLERIDVSALHPGLKEATVVGATDVINPLCGPTGASAVYGPQKGASAEVVAELDAALAHYAAVVKRDLGKDVLETPRAGAAGGLGAGLLAFAGGELRSGIDMVCDVLGFDDLLIGADLVITGEGRADRSTVYDKAPVGVARRALAQGVPTVLLAGGLGPGYQELYQHGIAAIVTIADRPMSFAQSLRRTEELLEAGAERAIRLMGVGLNISR
ncbi:MAG: glycerate kinase [SAR202 cluster bacterium Io17-Chloro-G9]|nr:MAG: glycerate kinase [SAR202 cluster bacterium Io17-Chloro-G9]